MDAVLLNGAGEMNQVLVDHRDKGNMVAGGECSEDLAEGVHVVHAVVGRQRDAGEKNFDMRGLKRAENLVEVAACLGEREAAEPVVSTEFDNYGVGVKAQNCWKAGNRVLGGGSAGTLIDDFVVIALCIQMPLQRIWEGLAFSEAVARGNAVAKADKDACRGGGKNARWQQEQD